MEHGIGERRKKISGRSTLRRKIWDELMFAGRRRDEARTSGLL